MTDRQDHHPPLQVLPDPRTPATPLHDPTRITPNPYAEWFRITIEHTLDCVIATDHSGRIVEFNQAAERLFSCRRQDVIGWNISRLLVPKGHRRYFHQALKKLRSRQNTSGNPSPVERRALTTDGREIPVEITVLPTRGDNTDSFLFFLRNLSRQGNGGARHVEKQLKKAMIQTIESISLTIDLRDPYTAAHQRRVAHLAQTIAEELDLPAATVEGIYLGALIHDIGKIAIPGEILSRPNRLDDTSMKLIRQHPTLGHTIVRHIDFPWPIADIVLQHHERMDGSGYPHQLAGDEVILEARIVAVADVVEAMSSHRPYRPSLGIDAALDEIMLKPQLYSPPIADACRRLFVEKGYQLRKQRHIRLN